MLTVFVASKGENGEGSYIIGIYYKKEDAVNKALSCEAYFGDKQWHPVRNMPDMWENGCDYITVNEYEVL